MYMYEIDISVNLIFLYAFHQFGIVIILAHQCNWFGYFCPSLLWLYCKCSCLILNFKFHIHCCFCAWKNDVIDLFFVCLVVVVIFLICCRLKIAMYRIFQVKYLKTIMLFVNQERFTIFLLHWISCFCFDFYVCNYTR